MPPAIFRDELVSNLDPICFTNMLASTPLKTRNEELFPS